MCIMWIMTINYKQGDLISFILQDSSSFWVIDTSEAIDSDILLFLFPTKACSKLSKASSRGKTVMLY